MLPWLLCLLFVSSQTRPLTPKTFSAKHDISSICVWERGFLKIAHLKASDLPIWFSFLLLFYIEQTQIENEEGRCEEEKIFYGGKYLCGNDEGVHHQEEKWAEFLMYKPEIQSCMCQMDMSEKVTVVFFHFMTQSDSYQSQIRPIKIMDISYSIDLIRQLSSHSFKCILSLKTQSTL